MVILSSSGEFVALITCTKADLNSWSRQCPCEREQTSSLPHLQGLSVAGGRKGCVCCMWEAPAGDFS